MKDSLLSSIGLFDPRRQARLLRGLDHRIRSGVLERAELSAQHASGRATDEERFALERSEMMAECRTLRREMLSGWDQAEENLTGAYERDAVALRRELNRLGVVFRRRRADEEKAIVRKVEARRQAVLQQYENRKNQPGQIKRKEIKQIDDSLGPIHQNRESARALTVRRLDRLPEVPPPENPEDRIQVPKCATVSESIDAIATLTRQCESEVAALQSGAASRVVDSFYLPIGVAAFVIVWAVVAAFVAPYPPWLWMAAGVIPAGVLGFSVYLILLWPLKRMTRRLYPRIERIAAAAEECGAMGRKISTDTANQAAAELVAQRDTHLSAASRWQEEQTEILHQRLDKEESARRAELQSESESIDQTYLQSFATVGQKMRAKADTVAQQITASIASKDQSLDEARTQATRERLAQVQRVESRLEDGVRRGFERMVALEQIERRQFPAWPAVIGGQFQRGDHLDFLPIGDLKVEDQLRQWIDRDQGTTADSSQANGQMDSSGQRNGSAMEVPESNASSTAWSIPATMPIVMHRRLHSGLVIQAAPESMNAALDVVHQMLWRLMSAAPAGRAKLTLIDPMGRGQNFTSFMALADHDPSLVGHRVWTTDSKIEARLAELAHHVEDVLQASLRDQFQRIEDYNRLAGSMAEPYRAVAAIGFPNGLSRQAYGHLRALIESGLRCGIFTALVCDSSTPWPADMPMPGGEHVLKLAVDAEGTWSVLSPGLEDFPFSPLAPPAASLRPELIEKIGTEAVAASRVEVPLESLLADVPSGSGDSGGGLDIAVGAQGANRSLGVKLGHGVAQHVLIAGKTGSGKSTLLHSIITSGAYSYRPDQLQFYLLDFKKGVEFKAYADAGLPHARVIGIESEREFGRSVLQRLDAELQERGEQFRATGVQELDHFRQASGQAMPRIMLVVDEFQELFIRDDRIAGDCAMLLDRLVRQGRSFGMHVVLSSQSLAGAYSLPRATLGQMAVRIAMQCSESDAALILSDDNTAARLISRPGEAIYNDAGGLVEGNHPFQVAWLSASRMRIMLAEMTERDQAFASEMAPPVIFEGNRPCRWTKGMAESVIDRSVSGTLFGLLGESVEIGPPISIGLTRDTGRNVLLIAPPESRMCVLASTLAGFVSSAESAKVIYFDGTRVDDGESLASWLVSAGLNPDVIKPRDAEAEIVALSELVKTRTDAATSDAPIIVVIDPLERFRDLRQDESFSFSLDSPGAIGGGTALQSVLRDGPAVGVFAVIVSGSAETLSRWLPRASQHDLEWRVLGQMNQSDSSMLIDSPIASELSAATMLLYDDADGRTTKFRQCDLPDAAAVKAWLQNLPPSE